MEFAVQHPQLEGFNASIGRRRFERHKNDNSPTFKVVQALKARHSLSVHDSETKPIKLKVKRRGRYSPEEELFRIEQKIAIKQEELNSLQKFRNINYWEQSSGSRAPSRERYNYRTPDLRKSIPKVFEQPYFTKNNPKYGLSNPITGSFNHRDLSSYRPHKQNMYYGTPVNRRLAELGSFRVNSPANFNSIIN